MKGGREAPTPGALNQWSQIFIVWTSILATGPEILILSPRGSHYF